MNQHIQQRVLTAAQKAEAKGLCQSSAGNFSMIDRESGLIYITPHGTDRFAMSWRDVIAMDLNAVVVEAAPGLIPSSEREIHAAIYRARADLDSICHTHSIYASIFAALSMEIRPVVSESISYRCMCPLSKYARPSTPELAQNIVEGLGKYAVATIMEKHGLLTASEKGIEEALRRAIMVEETANIYYHLACLLGIDKVPTMPMEEMEAVMATLRITNRNPWEEIQ